MMEVELDLDKSPNIIFTKENIDKMEKRIYWALISGMFGLTFAALGMNAISMFIVILCIGYFNPDDRLNGKFS